MRHVEGHQPSEDLTTKDLKWSPPPVLACDQVPVLLSKNSSDYPKWTPPVLCRDIAAHYVRSQCGIAAKRAVYQAAGNMAPV
jgi:hypothetical protein